MNPAAAVPIAALERQLREGAGRLRFLPELEPLYLAERADAIATRRLALIAASLVLVGLAPALNAFVLHPPEAFNGPALAAQFGMMIPCLLAAGASTLLRRLRPWQDPVAALAAVLVTGGLLFQRHIGATLGFVVPIALVSVVLLGTAVLGGLRLAWFLPALVVIVVSFTANEIGTFGATPSVLNTVFAMTMMGILAGIGSYMEERAARAGWLHRRLAEEMAVQDSLSGLANARAFRDLYPRLFAAAQRDGIPLLVAMVDIDWFKNYNDHYGHLAGDECLKRVAQTLPRHGRRATDLQARVGGEEFALVWYDVGPERAPALLEAVRAGVEALRIPHEAAPAGPKVVTVSVGGTCLLPQQMIAPAALLAAADEQMYKAKGEGRNRISFGQASAQPGGGCNGGRVGVDSSGI